MESTQSERLEDESAMALDATGTDPLNKESAQGKKRAREPRPADETFKGLDVCFACNCPLPEKPCCMGQKSVRNVINKYLEGSVEFARGMESLFPKFCSPLCRQKSSTSTSGRRVVHNKFLHYLEHRVCRDIGGWFVGDKCFVEENYIASFKISAGVADIKAIRIKGVCATSESRPTVDIEYQCEYATKGRREWLRASGIRKLRQDDMHITSPRAARVAHPYGGVAGGSFASSRVAEVERKLSQVQSEFEAELERIGREYRELSESCAEKDKINADLERKVHTLSTQLSLEHSAHQALDYQYKNELARELEKRGLLTDELNELREARRVWEDSNDKLALKLLVAEGQLTHLHRDTENLTTELDRCKRLFEQRVARREPTNVAREKKLERKVRQLERSLKDKQKGMVEMRIMCRELEVNLRNSMVRESALQSELDDVCTDAKQNEQAHGTLLDAIKLHLDPDERAVVDAIRSPHSLGIGVDSVQQMGRSRRDDLGRLAALYVNKVLENIKAGTPDAKGVLSLVLQRTAGQERSRKRLRAVDCTDDPLVKSIATAYIAAVKGNRKDHARAILSGLACDRRLTTQQIMELCSEDKDIIAVGTKVLVEELVDEEDRETSTSATVRYVPGTIAAMPDDDYELHSEQAAAAQPLSSSASPTTPGERNFYFLIDIIAGDDLPTRRRVPAHQVVLPRVVTCTEYQVKAARIHARIHGSFSEVPAKVKQARVERVRGPRAAFVLAFLRDDSVVQIAEASKKNIAKGLRYRLKQPRWALFSRLYDKMRAANLKPISWGYFFALTTTKEYEVMTADTCCCRSCRNLGFYAFDNLRDLVSNLQGALELALEDPKKQSARCAAALEELKTIHRRIDRNQCFYRGAFCDTHLETESPTASHCMCLALTAGNDPRFMKPCTHGLRRSAEAGSDDIVGPEIPTWDTVGMQHEARNPQSRRGRQKETINKSWWNIQCEFCSEGGRLLMCTYCNVVAHRACAKAFNNDVPPVAGSEHNWTCTQCMQQLDGRRHVMDCEECNELNYIFIDISQKIDLLRKIAPLLGVDEASSRTSTATTMAAELKDIRGRLDQYVAHLTRTKAQAYVKYDYMQLLAEDDCAWYSLSDYWAKLTPGKSKKVTCDGTQPGISCHGTTFYYKNPSAEQRAMYIARHGLKSDYFDGFPSPEEQAFVCENYQALSNDPKQDVFHTRCVLDETYARFLSNHPWLSSRRRGILQSDNAVNYREPTYELDQECISVRVFSEAGEGKDEGDSNAGMMKQGLRRYQDMGKDLEDAPAFADALDYQQREGAVNFIVDIDRSKQMGVLKKRTNVPHISRYSMWVPEVNQNGDTTGLRFYESYDHVHTMHPSNKEKEMKGFGKGEFVSADAFERKHRCWPQATGATSHLRSGGKKARLMPKGRSTKAQRETAAEKQRAERDAKKVAVSNMQAREAAQRQANEQSLPRPTAVVYQCETCSKTFATTGGLVEHMNNQESCDAVLSRRRRSQKYPPGLRQLLTEHDKNMAIAETKTISELNLKRVLIPDTVTDIAAFGLLLKEQDVEEEGVVESDSATVVAVQQVVDKSDASFCGCISPGYLLTHIDGHPVKRVADVNAAIKAATSACNLTFVRPQPELPLHGSARRALFPVKKVTLTPEQKDFLKRMFYGASRMRDSEVYRLMKEEFRNKLSESGRPLWLTQDQIASWMSDYWGKIKGKAKAGAKQDATIDLPDTVSSSPSIGVAEGDGVDEMDNDSSDDEDI